jgi:hypothetical protein
MRFVIVWLDWPANLYGEPDAISRSHDAVIRGYDATGRLRETHEHNGDFKEP